MNSGTALQESIMGPLRFFSLQPQIKIVANFCNELRLAKLFVRCHLRYAAAAGPVYRQREHGRDVLAKNMVPSLLFCDKLDSDVFRILG